METQNKISNAAFLRWMKPVLTALKELGGQGKPQEVRHVIAKNEHLTEEELLETRGKNNVNKFENEVAFARNYLVSGGYIDKSAYGMWKLTKQGWNVDMTDELASNLFKQGMTEVSLTILSKTLNADFGDIMEYVPDAEIWDLYNENRELLGRDHVRGEQLPIDGYHLVVHVWIRNSKGEYLISQRSANRPTYPLMWECVGGSVVKGEDSLQGAIRETKEEVGIDLEPSNGQVLFTKTRKIIEGKIFNDIMDVWLFEYDGEVDLSNATTDEVAQVAWMNREQIKELFEQKMFVDTLDYFFTETFF